MQIQQLTNPNQWFYVNTKSNPADILSRGLPLKQLCESELWWSGPSWLHETDIILHPFKPQSNVQLLEAKLQNTCLVTIQETDTSIVKGLSNLTKLKRFAALCFRILNNMRDKSNKITGELLPSELEQSLTRLIKICQLDSFKLEIKCIELSETLPKASKLLKLSPFLDAKGMLRVGGRIDLSNLPYEAKHPLLLDSKQYLTRIIFKHEYMPQWPSTSFGYNYAKLLANWRAKSSTSNCTKCRRFNAKPIVPLMGNLPKSRLVPMFPFQITGLDYAGPFQVKDRMGRGCRITKAYLCLFICFSTKAIHLEIASDLTTERFLPVLKRFVSRRGKPSEIHSDNGTNFVGANNEMLKIIDFLKQTNSKIIRNLANDNILWKFIPPYTPHMGGLWEAGVKSAKQCIKKVVGDTILTYEEIATVVSQVEAALNSRPLYPLQSDPNDYQALTPGHFLVGRPMNSTPDINLEYAKINTLTRYQLLQKCINNSGPNGINCTSELQRRNKWTTNTRPLSLNDLVIIKEDNQPPLQWLLGRVVQVHPGADGIVRVASIKMKGSVLKRAVHRLVPLLNNTDSND